MAMRQSDGNFLTKQLQFCTILIRHKVFEVISGQVEMLCYSGAASVAHFYKGPLTTKNGTTAIFILKLVRFYVLEVPSKKNLHFGQCSGYLRVITSLLIIMHIILRRLITVYISFTVYIILSHLNFSLSSGIFDGRFGCWK